MPVQTQNEPRTFNKAGQVQPMPQINVSLKISNLTSSILPIGAGVKLQAGQTRIMNTPSIQLIEELIPRLNRLTAAGKVSFKVMPATPADLAELDQLRCGIKGTIGSGTWWAQPDYTTTTPSGQTAPLLAFISDSPVTLQSFAARVLTAPTTAAITIAAYVSAVATPSTWTLTPLTLIIPVSSYYAAFPAYPPVGPQDGYDLNAGDALAFRVVTTDTVAAGLIISATAG
jgi:hypothetical protein